MRERQTSQDLSPPPCPPVTWWLTVQGLPTVPLSPWGLYQEGGNAERLWSVPRQELGAFLKVLAVSLLLGHVLKQATEPGFSIGGMGTWTLVQGDIGNRP